MAASLYADDNQGAISPYVVMDGNIARSVFLASQTDWLYSHQMGGWLENEILVGATMFCPSRTWSDPSAANYYRGGTVEASEGPAADLLAEIAAHPLAATAEAYPRFTPWRTRVEVTNHLGYATRDAASRHFAMEASGLIGPVRLLVADPRETE